jgi:hypothetical protein
MEWVVSFTPRPLYHRGKSPQFPLDRRFGWTPELVWTTWKRENSSPYRDSNSDPSVVQPVAGHYTDCAIPARFFYLIPQLKYMELHFTLHTALVGQRNYSKYFTTCPPIRHVASLLIQECEMWLAEQPSLQRDRAVVPLFRAAISLVLLSWWDSFVTVTRQVKVSSIESSSLWQFLLLQCGRKENTNRFSRIRGIEWFLCTHSEHFYYIKICYIRTLVVLIT